MGGEFSSNRKVTLRDVRLPELMQDRVMPELEARIFKTPCRYDVILGRDALRYFGINLDFHNMEIETGPESVAMRAVPPDFTGPADLARDLQLDSADPFYFDSSNDDAFALPESSDQSESSCSILPADYRPADILATTQACTHLPLDKREQLYNLLKNYQDVFDGKLKVYPDELIHLDIDPTIQPHRSRAYPIPRSQLRIFKQELDRLVKIGVLSPCGRSTWISGSFIIPKKDKTVRWISDFRALNKALKRKVYPIPRIQDILSRRSGYKFLTKLDISMQYYTFELDDASKDLCTIATPFGLYRYNRLPMGVSQSPDIAQEVMEHVLRDIENIEIYIDDIACFSNSFEEHITLLKTVLDRLQTKGFVANPRKCEWAVQETDFLGHWLTPDGVKPYPKKIKAIMAMQPPKNIKQLRAFLGLVTYYRDMWPRRSHILAPLTELLKTPKTFRWGAHQQRAFEQMKSLVQADTMLAYPDHNKPFHIETDASDFQLGAVIKQDNKPVAFYTRKLTDTQTRYTTIEKELLSIVETLKEFRTMLLGAELHIYTDHKNLTYKLSRYTTDRVLRWKLLLEEYAPEFHYIKGPDNVVADSLSRTPTKLSTYFAECDYCELPENLSPATESFLFTPMAEGLMAMPSCAAQTDSHPVDDSYLFHPRFDPAGNLPFHFRTLHHYQQNDPNVTSLPNADPNRYFVTQLDTYDIICRRDNLTDPLSTWKIVLPTAILRNLVQWYHEITAHSTGMDRLEHMIRRHFHHPNLRQTCRSVISSCTTCPQVRTSSVPSGQLAPRTAPIIPWSEVHIDFIGPWNVEVNKQKFCFDALTCIDPVTNLIEIIRLRGPKTAENARRLFENHWLARYPRPTKVVHDHGPEFQGHDFQFSLDYHGLTPSNISPHTPTANSIIEATHKTIGQVFRTLIHMYPPNSQQDAENLIDDAIATAMHALRCNPVSTLGNFSPGALVFQRDMLLNIPLIADIITLTQNRQALIDNRLIRANRRRTRHEYRVNDQVFVYFPDRKHKLDLVREGPFPILQVHTNNTVTIQKGLEHHRISIRHLTPYKPS